VRGAALILTLAVLGPALALAGPSGSKRDSTVHVDLERVPELCRLTRDPLGGVQLAVVPLEVDEVTSESVALAITADGVRDARAQTTVDAADFLAAERAEQEKIARLTGLAEARFKGRLELWIDRSAPVELVARTLDTAAEQGFVEVRVFVLGSQGLPHAPFLDRDPWAAEVLTRWRGMTEAQRRSDALRHWNSALPACPSVTDTVRTIMAAPPEMQCTLVSQGLMPELLTQCPESAARRLTSLMLLPDLVHAPAIARTMRIDPDAEPVPVAAGSTWGQVAASVLEGRQVRLKVE